MVARRNFCALRTAIVTRFLPLRLDIELAGSLDVVAQNKLLGGMDGVEEQPEGGVRLAPMLRSERE